MSIIIKIMSNYLIYLYYNERILFYENILRFIFICNEIYICIANILIY